MNLSSTLGSLAGAGVLSLLSQGAKKIDQNAPRLDVLGNDIFSKLLKTMNIDVRSGNKLYPIALAGNFVGNTLYQGLSGGTRQQKITKGALLGLTAGIGAVLLSESKTTSPIADNRNTKTQLMTIGWYVLGGVVAGAAASLITRNDIKENATIGKVQHESQRELQSIQPDTAF